jgi:glycosyltransferase involved in cell wall biosynthesis
LTQSTSESGGQAPPARISVVIPVWNGADFLAEAIDSALAQTWPDVEVIVVDDGSTDDGATVAVAQRYGDRIRLLRRPHGGVSAVLNAGIDAMSGAYFAWLSHDDVFLPDKLATQMAAIRRHGSDAIVYTDYELVDAGLRRIKVKRLPDLTPGAFRLWLMTHSALHGGTILVPRAWLDGERFDERLTTTQDYDMWFRLALRYPFLHVPEVLLRYRIHGRQESWTNPRRIEEGNRLLIGFLDAVGPAEIRAATTDPPSVVHLRAALRYRVRGYRPAAEHARSLAATEARTDGSRWSPRRWALLAAYRVAHPSLRPMAWWKRRHLGPEPMAALTPAQPSSER